MSWFIDSTHGAITGSGLGIGWIAGTALGVRWGRTRHVGRNANRGTDDASPLRSLLARLAPLVFIAGLLLALSFGIHLLLLRFICCTYPNSGTLCDFFCKCSTCTLDRVLPESRTLWEYHWLLLDQLKSWWQSFWFFVACLVSLFLAAVLSWRVGINEFSLHHFYKNRLVRCYLGASRGEKRKSNPFTGFDPNDDVHLARFSRAETAYSGPYPIINAALNLVHGDNLAWQERKAESFIMTPRYCGFDVTSSRAAQADIADNGYRPTPGYAYPVSTKRVGWSGIHIGTAMAISGAAASPNMGAGTSPASSFLMTVFNVRLGWWLGNPRHRTGHKRSDPGLGLGYLLAELLGLTNDESKYVYLSDGGHFENLGIYELVRRECRYIVVCDAEEDPDFKFRGLGNAIRKCRSDFGAEIEIDVDQIRRDPATMRSASHCVVGTIKYKSGLEGCYLVYIKSSLTGDEPSDILQYASEEPAFPHQSTTDQWFNESQFESYRKLGYHIGKKAFELAQKEIHLGEQGKGPDYRKDFFDALRQRWYPRSPANRKFFTKHTEKLDEIMERLRTDPALSFLDAQFYHEWRELLTRPGVTAAPVNLWLPGTEEEIRNAFYFCNSLIQLMENVYIDLNLEDYWEYPDNRGWIRLFKEWMESAMFCVTWAIAADTYGARFQTFCRVQLHQDLAALVKEEWKRGSMPTPLSDDENKLMTEKMQSGDSLHLLYIEVKEAQKEGSSVVRFRFGFALQEAPGKLRFVFVKPDLKDMGLERRASDLFKAATPKPC